MANATRSTTTDAEAADSPVPTDEYCPCQRAFTLDREHHDWLLSFEGRGVAGVVELFDYAERSAEHGHEDGKLSWLELEPFMAMHRWDRPAHVYDLVGIIDQMVRFHQGLMPGDQPDAGMNRTTAAVDSLRSELAALRHQLATEVRTRRLVVVNQNGFESIVAEADAREFASVKVTSQEDPSVWSSIHAGDDGGVSSGFYLSGGGNGVGMFQVDKREHALGTKDEVVDYTAHLLIDEDRGPSVTLNHEGLEFSR